MQELLQFGCRFINSLSTRSNANKMFDSRSLRKISTNELNWLKRNYKISECEDGKEGISRKDFSKNMPGKDVSKHNKSNCGYKAKTLNRNITFCYVHQHTTFISIQ